MGMTTEAQQPQLPFDEAHEQMHAPTAERVIQTGADIARALRAKHAGEEPFSLFPGNPKTPRAILEQQHDLSVQADLRRRRR